MINIVIQKVETHDENIIKEEIKNSIAKNMQLEIDINKPRKLGNRVHQVELNRQRKHNEEQEPVAEVG